MLVRTADLRVPPPPRRAVLRASAATAAAVAATVLTHGVLPILRTGTSEAAQACHAVPPGRSQPFAPAEPP